MSVVVVLVVAVLVGSLAAIVEEPWRDMPRKMVFLDSGMCCGEVGLESAEGCCHGRENSGRCDRDCNACQKHRKSDAELAGQRCARRLRLPGLPRLAGSHWPKPTA